MVMGGFFCIKRKKYIPHSNIPQYMHTQLQSDMWRGRRNLDFYGRKALHSSNQRKIISEILYSFHAKFLKSSVFFTLSVILMWASHGAH